MRYQIPDLKLNGVTGSITTVHFYTQLPTSDFFFQELANRGNEKKGERWIKKADAESSRNPPPKWSC
jgi:hypothetical protein